MTADEEGARTDAGEGKGLPEGFFGIEVIANKPIPEMFDREIPEDDGR